MLTNLFNWLSSVHRCSVMRKAVLSRLSAIAHVPNLFSYHRLFQPPNRAPLNQIFHEDSSANQKFYAGANKVSLLENRFLGSMQGDLPLAGYGNRQNIDWASIKKELNPKKAGEPPHHHFFKKNAGILDPVYSRALIIKAGEVKVAMVSLDLIIVSQDLYDIVFQKLTDRRIGFHTRNQLILSATHTHSGPGAYATRPFWKLATGDIFAPAVMDKLSDGIVESIVAAGNSIEEVKIGFGKFQLPGLQSNRRKKFYAPDQAPLDDEVVYQKILRMADNSILGFVVNFPLHCTALSASNIKFSSDIGGAIMSSLENRFSGSTALFINGAEGDVSPHAPGEPDMMQFIGGQIALAIEKESKGISCSEKGRLAIANKHIQLPEPRLDLSAMDSLSGNNSIFLSDYISGSVALTKWVEESSYFGAVCLDNTMETLTISTIPGEAITDVGLMIKNAIREKAANKNTFSMIAGLSNGYIGYITTKEQFHKGGYESLATLYGENTDQFIVNSVTGLHASLLSQ